MTSRRTFTAAGILVLAAAVAFVVYTVFGGKVSDSSVEAGFARDMSSHHRQAVEMSFIIRDRTDDEDVRRLAYDIATSQSAQIGMMTAWLDAWGLPHVDPAGRMRWMSGHPGHTTVAPGAPMPGMATDAQLKELRAAHGRAAEILFLKLMIAHHQGGVDMARAAVDRAKEPEVQRLARTMVNGQRSEIELMNGMLAEREKQQG
ncbi:MAG: DUF305 domain-containing protein [Streptosporangiales bacterium]|nr:DUF305 domain-containing protein [Streptosporangiales bacterium]